jgi:hypothetical protein
MRTPSGFLERSISINPDFYGHQWTYRFLAAGYARRGRLAEAKHALGEADRLFPYDTVRSHWPDDPSSTVFAEQIRQMQEALRVAGERDHAVEDADFGVPVDAQLHSEFAGLTTTTLPGATTIRTTDLAKLLTQSRPVVIDTVSYSWGRSIPGAIGLSYSGVGGSFSDAVQDRLRRKLRERSARSSSQPRQSADRDCRPSAMAATWRCALSHLATRKFTGTAAAASHGR